MSQAEDPRRPFCNGPPRTLPDRMKKRPPVTQRPSQGRKRPRRAAQRGNAAPQHGIAATHQKQGHCGRYNIINRLSRFSVRRNLSVAFSLGGTGRTSVGSRDDLSRLRQIRTFYTSTISILVASTKASTSDRSRSASSNLNNVALRCVIKASQSSSVTPIPLCEVFRLRPA